jgi:hypothetical protein
MCSRVEFSRAGVAANDFLQAHLRSKLGGSFRFMIGMSRSPWLSKSPKVRHQPVQLSFIERFAVAF